MQQDKKEKNFWVALDVEDFKKLNSIAESKNIPIKEFAGNILKKSLVKDDEISIILKIPKNKLSSPEILQEWMNQKTQELIGILSKKTN